MSRRAIEICMDTDVYKYWWPKGPLKFLWPLRYTNLDSQKGPWDLNEHKAHSTEEPSWDLFYYILQESTPIPELDSTQDTSGVVS
jgi:hypothetical protein